MFLLHNIEVKEQLTIREMVIPSDKTTCIVGPSGCGKSTLLRLLNRLISPTSGTISFHGEVLTKLDPIQLRRNVVMLQQNPYIFDGTVKDNLLIGLQFSEQKSIQDDELPDFLKMVHVHVDLLDNATNLSGGEKQRLALARILLMKPQVLLLDEPTSALDETTAVSVMKNVKQYCLDISCTIIMISHTTHLVDLIADNVIDLSIYNEECCG